VTWLKVANPPPGPAPEGGRHPGGWSG